MVQRALDMIWSVFGTWDTLLHRLFWVSVWLAVGLGLVALAGLVVAYFAATDSTFYLRVIGFLVFAVAGLASSLTFIRSRKALAVGHENGA